MGNLDEPVAKLSSKENHIKCATPIQKYTIVSSDNKHGINNWTLMAFLILFANLVIENYLSYGMIKGPLEMTYLFMAFLRKNWWIYNALFLSYLLQIVFCFSIEKSLSLRRLHEHAGMVLHALNSTFLFLLSTALFNVYKFNPVAAAAVSVHVFHMCVKFWGYAYTNMIYRKNCNLQEASDESTELNGRMSGEVGSRPITYPQNVTLKNTFDFMACTGSSIYSIDNMKKGPIELKKILAGIARAVGIHYGVAFLMYQYLLPEADKAVVYIDTQQYLRLTGAVLRMAVPLNLAWILYFYFYCFGCYLPSFSWVWGTADVKLAREWWNCENSTVFWASWNYQVHVWFKKCFFLPALSAGYSKQQAAFLVAFVSGIMHEYLICVPCRTGYGLATFVMICQIPLAHLTGFVAKRFGARLGNMVMWLCLVFGHVICTVFMYYSYMKTYAK